MYNNISVEIWFLKNISWEGVSTLVASWLRHCQCDTSMVWNVTTREFVQWCWNQISKKKVCSDMSVRLQIRYQLISLYLLDIIIINNIISLYLVKTCIANNSNANFNRLLVNFIRLVIDLSWLSRKITSLYEFLGTHCSWTWVFKTVAKPFVLVNKCHHRKLILNNFNFLSRWLILYNLNDCNFCIAMQTVSKIPIQVIWKFILFNTNF